MELIYHQSHILARTGYQQRPERAATPLASGFREGVSTGETRPASLRTPAPFWRRRAGWLDGWGEEPGLLGLAPASGGLGPAVRKVLGTEGQLGDSAIHGACVRHPGCGCRSQLHPLIRFTGKADLREKPPTQFHMAGSCVMLAHQLQTWEAKAVTFLFVPLKRQR